MKIKFENDLEYQQDAIKAVTDVFKGQEKLRSNFTVLSPKSNGMQFGAETGHANKVNLAPKKLVENVQDIQMRNGRKISNPNEVDKSDLQFSIEMETGTGKTYVFTRSILEMNRKYGFKKFVIVVPSVSIREGIYKSLQLTEDHFAKEFENVPYKYFIYDSKNLSQVRDFATSDQIRIMIINIQAFARGTKSVKKRDIKSAEDLYPKKVGRILLDYNDKLGAKPIDLIKETNPVVIVDEPQTTMSSPLQKASIKNLNPSIIYRFSATHREKVNPLYKFDAIDAYNDGKVKKIEVASITTQDEASDGAYVQCVSVSNKKSIKAKLNIDVKNRKGKVQRKAKTIKQGDDLSEITRLDQYFGYKVREIYAGEPSYVEFANGQFVKEGETLGGLDDKELKRKLIAKTIRTHLDKEVKLNPKGIKVLSLFFIDKVEKYREYDPEGNATTGEYAKMFEEEYEKAIRLPKYQSLFEEILDKNTPVDDIHKGYFSIDKKGKQSNKKDKFEYFKNTSGTTKKDEDTYQLIMKDKEKLLNFKSPVRFIFSHSALKEGWDNPNVFQICLLKEMGGSKIRRRQEIGRGLRIAVNQKGERIYDENLNILTTVVNESFKSFVEGYQTELSDDTGIRFGYLALELFNNVVIDIDEEDEPVYLGQDESTQIFKHFIEKGYVHKSGKIQDSLKVDLKEGKVDLGKEFDEKTTKQIKNIIKEVAGNLEIKNQEEKKEIKVNKKVYLSEDFKSLWDSIKYKTIYKVDFDSDELIEECIKSINDNVRNQSSSIFSETATIDVKKSGVKASEDTISTYTEAVETEVKHLPDIITYLQNETDLTRLTIIKILKGIEPGVLNYFKRNPQSFIENCIAAINSKKEVFIVDGIQYEKIDDDSYYDQKLIEEKDVIGYLNRHLVESTKSAFEYTVCDSDVEMNLTKEFEKSDNIKLYTKLPDWFTVPTPLGNYNPDWAILYKKGGGEKLYFITESKGTIFDENLRPTESAKIKCGKAHFSAMSSRLIKAHTIDDVHQEVNSF